MNCGIKHELNLKFSLKQRNMKKYVYSKRKRDFVLKIIIFSFSDKNKSNKKKENICKQIRNLGIFLISSFF